MQGPRGRTLKHLVSEAAFETEKETTLAAPPPPVPARIRSISFERHARTAEPSVSCKCHIREDAGEKIMFPARVKELLRARLSMLPFWSNIPAGGGK